MRKVIKCILVMLMCFTVVGCGQSDEEENKELTNNEIFDKVNVYKDGDWYFSYNMYVAECLEIRSKVLNRVMFSVFMSSETGEVTSITYYRLLEFEDNRTIYSTRDEELASDEYIESAKETLADIGITLEDLIRYATSDYRDEQGIE